MTVKISGFIGREESERNTKRRPMMNIHFLESGDSFMHMSKFIIL